MYLFSDVIGHEFILSSLKKSIAGGKVAHAYIFDGMEGVGKKLVAGSFAKTLQCLSGETEPCNECISCRAFDDGNHTDTIYVVPKKGQTVGVDDIREQVNTMAKIKPYRYKYKIFIIDNADSMTVQAQNALLKTIEEPPSYAIFILVSKNMKNFLPTIISRCIIYKLKPANNNVVENYLENKGFSEKDAVAASAMSEGSIGKAIMLLEDENFKEDRAEIVSILNSLPDSNLWDILLLAKKMEKFKDNWERMLDSMYLWYRDAIVYKVAGSGTNFLQKDIMKNIVGFSNSLSLKRLMQGIDSIVEAKAALKYNGNFLLTMEVMLMKMTGV